MTVQNIVALIAFVLSNLSAFWFGRRAERGLQPTQKEIDMLLVKARLEGAESIIFTRMRDSQERLNRMAAGPINKSN